MKCILVAPQFDEATQYSYRWAQKLKQAIGGQAEIVPLLLADAVRAKVEDALRSNPDAVLIHYDHGNQTSLIGQDMLPVLDLRNVALLSKHESYNMNCLSAVTLGKQAYKDGCLAYWGYTQEVAFTTEGEEKFGDAFGYGLILRVSGKTWAECLNLAREKMTEIVNEFVDEGNPIAAMSLRQDRDALVCYDGSPPPPENCPVSRIIAALLGYRALTRLRQVRDKVRAQLHA